MKEVAKRLNVLVADEYVLYTKTRNAHWNIQGNNFMELHKFFESQYEELDDIIDDVAERVRALGHLSIGSLSDFIELTHLSEQKHDFGNQKQMIQALLEDHETIIRSIRNEITNIANTFGDAGTSDFVTGIMEQHEKMAWMLRAYIS